MIVRKPDRLIRRSSWPPGTWHSPICANTCIVVTGHNLIGTIPRRTHALQLYSFNNRGHWMIVRKPDRLIRRSSLATGYLSLPDLCEHMYSRHGTQFNWYDSTRTHALHYSTHSTIGGTG